MTRGRPRWAARRLLHFACARTSAGDQYPCSDPSSCVARSRVTMRPGRECRMPRCSSRPYHHRVHIPPVVRELIAQGPIGHVVTLGADGSPQVTLAWVGVEDDEVVIGTLPDQVKLHNIRRDPRVAISMVTGR